MSYEDEGYDMLNAKRKHTEGMIQVGMLPAVVKAALALNVDEAGLSLLCDLASECYKNGLDFGRDTK